MSIDHLKTLPQYLIPQHILSRLVGYLANCRCPRIKNRFIDWFIKRYQVDMSCAIEPDPHQYPDFNSFFTRRLRDDARPKVTGEKQLICPVDGQVSQVGAIQEGRIFQAKGFDFSLAQLLGGSTQRAAPFVGGQFVTLYLAPKDYHRIHMPLTGELQEMVYVPGRLFSVNFRTARIVPELFARNERVVAIFNTAIGQVAIVLVGAMIVASIGTAWHGEVTGSHGNKVQTWDYRDRAEPIRLERGAEMGLFKLGSTVLVLFEPAVIDWASRIQPEQEVQLGELLGVEII